MKEQEDTMRDDDLARMFSDLATMEVPHDLDPAAVSARGRRRIARRRWISAAGGAALATAAVAVLAVSTGAIGTQATVAGGPSPTTGPSPAFADSPTSVPKSPSHSTSPGQRPRETPLAGWLADWEAGLVALKVPVNPYHGSKFGQTEAESSTSVVEGKSAGYVAMIGTIAADKIAAARNATTCPINLYPVNGKGMRCRQHTDARGTYWMKTYDDSYQGRTVIVQVASRSAVVIFAQSQGFPGFQLHWDSSTVDVLPWDSRDPRNPESGHFQAAARLDALPLTVNQQVELARKLAQR